MKEMWTGIHHKNGDEIYEIKFKTNDFNSYKFVQKACREAIDTNWTEDMPYQEEIEEESDQKFRWLSLDGNLFDLSEERIVEYQCPKCGKEYLFKIDEMDWNDCGWFECVCGYKVTYEKV